MFDFYLAKMPGCWLSVGLPLRTSGNLGLTLFRYPRTLHFVFYSKMLFEIVTRACLSVLMLSISVLYGIDIGISSRNNVQRLWKNAISYTNRNGGDGDGAVSTVPVTSVGSVRSRLSTVKVYRFRDDGHKRTARKSDSKISSSISYTGPLWQSEKI